MLPVEGVDGELEEPATRLVSKLKAGGGHERVNRQSVELSARGRLNEQATDFVQWPASVYAERNT